MEEKELEEDSLAHHGWEKKEILDGGIIWPISFSRETYHSLQQSTKIKIMIC